METPQDHLRIIYEMIDNAKEDFREGAFYYLLWGWLVLIASLATFVFLKLGWGNHSFYAWPVLMGSGGIIALARGFRTSRTARVQTYVSTATMYLWIGFSISLLLILTAYLWGKLPYDATYPIFIVFYGLGAFVSGGILRFRPLVVGGLLSWAIAAFAFAVPFEYQLLLTALSVAVSWLTPGYLLKMKQE